MTPLSDGERRALALLAALILLASAARWIERPESILGDVPEIDITALAEASRDAKEAKSPKPRGAAAPARGTATVNSSASTTARIDPNQASVEQLATLPGIGPALAARIVAERERAPFSTVADLRRVRGIGPALAAKLADRVTLPADASPSRTPQQPNGEPIDLNRATAEQLQTISGIGPALAARLLAKRDSLRGFRTFDDVDAVRGIGPAVLERIRAAAVIR